MKAVLKAFIPQGKPKFSLRQLGLFSNYGYADPPPFRSGHLDIKDAQCAEKNNGRKISYRNISRLDAAAAQKRRFEHPKIQLSILHYNKIDAQLP